MRCRFLTLGALGAIFAVTARALIAAGPVAVAIFRAALIGSTVIWPILALTPGSGRLLVKAWKIAFDREFAAIVGFRIAFLPALAARAARFILTDPAIGEHAEIMVGKLEVIFRRYPIAILMGVLGKLAIFLKQLRGIAARPAVNPVELLAATATTAAALGAIVASPAPTIVVDAVTVATIIVVQGCLFLNPRPPPGLMPAGRSHDPEPRATHRPRGTDICPGGWPFQTITDCKCWSWPVRMGILHPSGDRFKT